MDVFESKNIEPMLIKNIMPAFDDEGWIYELKLDGIRCIAYLGPDKVDIRNKKTVSLLPRFPELGNINLQVREKCILDGELVIIKDGVPDFYTLQRRCVLSNQFKIHRACKELPASFVAFDILYYKDREVTCLPLMERKTLLSDVVMESGSIAVSRYIEQYGAALYKLTEERKLEGVVAKRKDSCYYYGKRSRDWVKFKRMADDEFVICGFVRKRPMNAFLLGQYTEDGTLVYAGSVSFGARLDILYHTGFKAIPVSPFHTGQPAGEEAAASNITWIMPELVCTIEYMPNMKGSIRQPVFKGLRYDIDPKECLYKSKNL